LAAVCGLQAPASRQTQQKQKQQHAACVITTCGMNSSLQARCQTRHMLLKYLRPGTATSHSDSWLVAAALHVCRCTLLCCWRLARHGCCCAHVVLRCAVRHRMCYVLHPEGFRTVC
jgi:hypothetical protein